MFCSGYHWWTVTGILKIDGLFMKFYYVTRNSRILKANLSLTRKKSNSSDAKKISPEFIAFFLTPKPIEFYQIKLSWG